MGWQMYSYTHSAFKLGLLGLVSAIPAISMALFSGLLVDWFSPFLIFRCVLLMGFTSVFLSWQAHGETGIFLAAAIAGLARSFYGPAYNSLIPRIVTREQIKQTSAYQTMAFKGAAVIGPGVAGVLLGLQGMLLPYLLSISALVLGIIVMFIVQVPEGNTARKKLSEQKILHELLIGVKFVFSHELLLSAMSLDMFAVLFGGATALLPIFAAEILKVGPHGLGWLRAAPSAGAILMGFYLVRRPVGKRAGHLFLGAVFGFGLCMIVFGLSKNFWLSMLALALSGAFDVVSMVVRRAILQLSSPENMRGRIASVNSIFIGSSNEIGEFESGIAASMMGTVPSVVFGGCMTLLTVGIVFVKSKALRTLDLGKL